MPKIIEKYQARINEVWQVCNSGDYHILTCKNYSQAEKMATLLNRDLKFKQAKKEIDEQERDR